MSFFIIKKEEIVGARVQ